MINLTQNQIKKLHTEQAASQLVINLHTLENEQSILGALLLAKADSELVQQLKSHNLTQSNFVSAQHKIFLTEIYKFFVTKRNQNTIQDFSLDFMEVSKDIALKYPEIFPKGYEEVRFLLLECVTKSNLKMSVNNSISEAKENYQKSLLSEIKKVDFNKMEVSESLAYLKNIFNEIDSQVITDKPLAGIDAMNHYMAEMEDKSNQKNIELPFSAFRDHGVVFGSTNLVSVAGSPKAGKTSFALQTAIEFAKQSKNVLFFTLELSVMEFMEKSLAYIANLNPVVIKNIHKPESRPEFVQRWSESCAYLFDNLKDNLAFIGDKKYSIWEICQTIKTANAKTKLDFIYIDQLSFIHTNNMFGSEKHKEYDYIVRELKELCKELKVCIVLLAQLNRGASGDDVGYANIQHIKDSSAIAETSDILILMKRNEKQANSNAVKIQVNCTVVSRHGKGGVVAIDWDTKLAKFEG
jgi:replicative DNA helicase